MKQVNSSLFFWINLQQWMDGWIWGWMEPVQLFVKNGTNGPIFDKRTKIPVLLIFNIKTGGPFVLKLVLLFNSFSQSGPIVIFRSFCSFGVDKTWYFCVVLLIYTSLWLNNAKNHVLIMSVQNLTLVHHVFILKATLRKNISCMCIASSKYEQGYSNTSTKFL